MAPFLSATTGWLLYAALLAATGGLAARWLVVPRVIAAPSGADRWLAEAAWRLTALGASLLPVALAFVFVRQLLDFRDPFVPWTEDAELLVGGTAWGRTWLTGVATSLLALGSVALAGRRGGGSRVGWPVAGAAILGLGAFPALTGHASGTEALRPLTVTADTLHVWAAGCWTGGIAFLLYSARGWRRMVGVDGSSLLPALVPAFSPLAVVSVAVLIGTGIVATWVHVPTLGALVSAEYGRLLSLKLLLAGLVFILGLRNWRRLTPRLEERQGQAALHRTASVELLLVQAVLLVTAILVLTPPPSP